MDRPVRNALGLVAGIGLASVFSHPLLYVALAVLCLLQWPAAWGRSVLVAACLGALAMSATLSQQREAEIGRAGQLDDREPEELLGTVTGPTFRLPGRQQVSLQTATGKNLAHHLRR